MDLYKEGIEVNAYLTNVPFGTLLLDKLAIHGGLQQRAVHSESATAASIKADNFTFGIGKISVVERVWTETEWDAHVRSGNAPQDTTMPVALRDGGWGLNIDLATDSSCAHRRFVVVDGNHRIKALQDLQGCEDALQVLKTDVQLLDCAETDRVR